MKFILLFYSIHDYNIFINILGLNLSDSSQLNTNADLNQLTLLPYSSGTTGLPKVNKKKIVFLGIFN